MNDVKKQIIFILDDIEEVSHVLKEYLFKHLPAVEIHTFNTYEDLKIHPLVKEVSLFVIDINLKTEQTGDQVALELHKINPSPFLFMSGLEYCFDSFEGNDLTYDFIKKPFDNKQSLNRVKVLLKVSENYNKQINEKTKLQVSLRELFNYTNIYMLILDENMIIKLCSYKLWKDLGYESEDELLGESWGKFVDPKEKNRLLTVHKNVINNSNEFQKSLREVTNKITTKQNTTIIVKWFNSRISNSHIYSFSIGIPYNRTITEEDEVETIRAYWKHVIEKDETTLNAIRSNVKEFYEC